MQERSATANITTLVYPIQSTIMVMIRISAAAFCLLALSASDVLAFTGPLKKASLVPQKTAFVRPLCLSDKKDDDTTIITSGSKEIAFDEARGRFFETDLNAEECIPDDEFCVVDKETGNMIRLTTEEKERIFLDALQAYYSSGRKLLSDDEFDLLKEDLTWNGSSITIMNRKEAQYLNAVQDYLKGTPSMGDADFDQLKKDLMEEGSKFAVQREPKCYIDSGICKVTLQEDKFRTNLLYLPAGVTFLLVWLGLGFELIEPLIRLNPVVLTLLGTPFIYFASKFVTEELIFTDKFVAYGPCPSCQVRNRVYFGNILGVEGFTDVASCKCPNCKVVFNVQRNTLRASTLPE